MQEQQLERGLKNRHVQLIAIGGAIGTGLFLGAGKSIHLAGPSILFAYMITGIICFLIMRALGELLLTNLKYNSFVDFVQRLFREYGSVYDWLDLLVLLDFNRNGGFNSSWSLYPVLVSRSTTVDARINCTCRFASDEPCNCKTFW